MEPRLSQVSEYLEAAAALQSRLAGACGLQVLAAADAVAGALAAARKVLLCGNGGSAADCQHVAAELVGQLSRDDDGPALAAVALTTDTSILTGCGNDRGFDRAFARQVEALGRPGDVLIAISTSGRSPNVLQAVAAAGALGMPTIGLSGQGGRLAEVVDVAIVIPAGDTQHVQEAMLPLEHLICALVERALLAPSPAPRVEVGA